MESETFRSRILALLQKSRRALRLYTTVGSSNGNSDSSSGEWSNVQVMEWRDVNSELLRKLALAVESPNAKKLALDIFSLRNDFHSLWRSSEAEMVKKQAELVSSAEQGDFVRSSSLSGDLIRLKARTQAAQAAHHELDMLIKKSKVSDPGMDSFAAPIQLLDDHIVGAGRTDISEEPIVKPPLARVIPLRKSRV